MEPRREQRPPELSEAERARIRRVLIRRLEAGGIAFLVVAMLGRLPRFLGSLSPSLERVAAIAVWIVAPAIGVTLIAVAAFRLRR